MQNAPINKFQGPLFDYSVDVKKIMIWRPGGGIVDTVDTADIVHTVDTLDIVKSVNSVDNVSSVNSVHNVHNAKNEGWLFGERGSIKTVLKN